jgi:hypothetical protein
MPVREIPDYRLNGGPPETVWAVGRDEVDAVLGATTRKERTARLRAIRDLGMLRHQAGKLSGKVRLRPAVAGDSGIVRAYLFSVPPEQLPRKRRTEQRPRERVLRW